MIDKRLSEERISMFKALNYLLDIFEDEYESWYGMNNEPLVNFYIMRASVALGQSVDPDFLAEILELYPNTEVSE